MARPITRAPQAGPPADRRATTRVLVDLEVDCEGDGVYLFAISRDLSATGIFVRTLEPMPCGTRVNLRLHAVHAAGPDDLDLPQRLTIEGEVVWVNPYRPGALENLDPGIGIAFVDVDDPTRAELMRLVRRIAYIDD